MSTSKHAFDQVKSILGKLDRSIDAARARRLDGSRAPSPAPAPAPAPAAAPMAAPTLASPAGPVTEQARPLRATPAFSTGNGHGVFPRRDRA